MREQPRVLPLLLFGPAVLEDPAGQGSQHSPALPHCCLPEVDGDGGSEHSGPLPWGSGQGVKRKQGPTHPGLLSSGALPLCEALRRTKRLCQVRPPGAVPAPKLPLSPASYPGTVVKAWHTRDALVSLLSFLQEGCWAGLLPLDTVPTDALRRERGG